MGAAAAGSLRDAEGLLDVTARFVRTARAQGALTELPVALGLRATADWLIGRLAEAEDRWTEMREIMAVSRSQPALGIDSRSEGLVLLYTGGVAAARAAGMAQIRASTARGQGGLADIGRAIVARAEICAGDFHAAADTAMRVVAEDRPFTAEATLPELIVAACRSGRRREAASAFGILSERALAAGTPWALGVRCRFAALLADGATARTTRTRRRSPTCNAAVPQSSSLVHICSTANGCAGKNAERHAASFAPYATCPMPWAPRNLPELRPPNCGLPARRPGHALLSTPSISRRRRHVWQPSPQRA